MTSLPPSFFYTYKQEVFQKALKIFCHFLTLGLMSQNQSITLKRVSENMAEHGRKWQRLKIFSATLCHQNGFFKI